MTVWEALYNHLNTELTLAGGLHFMEAEFTGTAPTYPYAVMDNVGPSPRVRKAPDGDAKGELRIRVDRYGKSKYDAVDGAHAVEEALLKLRGVSDGWHFEAVAIRDSRHLPLATPGTYRWYVDAAITYTEA